MGLATSVVLSSMKPSESTTTVGHMFDHKGKNYYGIVMGVCFVAPKRSIAERLQR